MTGQYDSEGLIPVDAKQQNTLSPVSPMHTAEGTNSYSTAPSEIASEPPVPPYERNGPSEAPIPVNPAPGSEKAYPGQQLQPVPNQNQPQTYYTPAGQPTGYATAVPLHALQSSPSPVDCPACGQRELTRIELSSGATNNGLAAVLCLCCCLGCIPYLISNFKDTNHFCGKCGAKLAVWHNSGKIEVLQVAGTPTPPPAK